MQLLLPDPTFQTSVGLLWLLVAHQDPLLESFQQQQDLHPVEELLKAVEIQMLQALPQEAPHPWQAAALFQVLQEAEEAPEAEEVPELEEALAAAADMDQIQELFVPLLMPI